MSKDMLKNLIELIPDEDLETLQRVIIKFIPEGKPLPDEIEAIQKADRSIRENGTVPHSAIDWD